VILITAMKEFLMHLPVGEFAQPLTDVAFGSLLVIILMLDPRGLYHRWEIFKAYYRIWPLAYK
jgi:branched-chain amino acid transport system permease protein